MLYTEYLNCALKHLKGCEAFLKTYVEDNRNDKFAFLELYYLSGYILEGISVYSSYKLYGWPINEDIKARYNIPFTTRTGLDYYYDRKVNRVSVFSSRNYQSLSIQGHHFQPIVKNLLRIDPSFNDVPYFGSGEIDLDVEFLIDKWEPGIRYCYEGLQGSYPTLSLDLLSRLINTCNTIYINHI